MPRLSPAECQLCADAFGQWLAHAERLKQTGQWNGHTGSCYYSEYGPGDTLARADGDGKVQLFRRWRGAFNLEPTDFLDKVTAVTKKEKIHELRANTVSGPHVVASLAHLPRTRFDSIAALRPRNYRPG